MQEPYSKQELFWEGANMLPPRILARNQLAAGQRTPTGTPAKMTPTQVRLVTPTQARLVHRTKNGSLAYLQFEIIGGRGEIFVFKLDLVELG